MSPYLDTVTKEFGDTVIYITHSSAVLKAIEISCQFDFTGRCGDK